MARSDYGILRALYPDHFKYFQYLQEGAKDVGTDFTRDRSGFLEFVEYIGPFPSDMKKPSLGRFDYTRGYVRENFRWQELEENRLESVIRNHVTSRAEVRAKIAASKIGIPRSEECRSKISRSKLGVPMSAETAASSAISRTGQKRGIYKKSSREVAERRRDLQSKNCLEGRCGHLSHAIRRILSA